VPPLPAGCGVGERDIGTSSGGGGVFDGTRMMASCVLWARVGLTVDTPFIFPAKVAATLRRGRDEPTY